MFPIWEHEAKQIEFPDFVRIWGSIAEHQPSDYRRVHLADVLSIDRAGNFDFSACAYSRMTGYQAIRDHAVDNTSGPNITFQPRNNPVVDGIQGQSQGSSQHHRTSIGLQKGAPSS